MIKILPPVKAPRRLNFVGVKLTDLELAHLDSLAAAHSTSRSYVFQALLAAAAPVDVPTFTDSYKKNNL